MSAAAIVQEARYLRAMIGEIIGIPLTIATQIYEDNQGCIALAKNPVYQARTKHIDTKYHFVREAIQNGEVRMDYCPTKTMLADVLTKAIEGPAFVTFRSRLMGG